MRVYVVIVYNSPDPWNTRLDGPFDDIEKARKHARKMTKLWGHAYIKTVHHPESVDNESIV